MTFMANNVTWTNVGFTSTTTTFTYNYSGNITAYTATGGNLRFPAPKKIKGGKYQVRCRSCSRWAKIIEETIVFGMPRWMVHCERCLGVNEGFVP